MSVETICPECGFSPVSGESCSNCGTRFDFVPVYKTSMLRHADTILDDGVEATAFYRALPDTVSVHPFAAVAMHLVGATVFLLEGALVFGPMRDAPLLLGLGVTNLLLAAGYAFGLGALRAIGYLLAPVQIAVVLWVGRENLLHPGVVLAALFPALSLFGTVLEPETWRRYGALGLTVIVMTARGFLSYAAPAPSARALALATFAAAGGALELPADVAVISPELHPEDVLPMPKSAPTRAALAFASRGGEQLGFALVDRAPVSSDEPWADLAQHLVQELSLKVEDDAFDVAPGELGGAPHVSYRVRTDFGGTDRSGVLTAAKAKDGRLVAALFLMPASMSSRLRADAFRVLSAVHFEVAAAPAKAP